MAHPCSNCDASRPGCSGCPIRGRGLGESFSRALRQIEAKLRRLELSEDEREEILGASVEGALRSLDSFSGRNGAVFSTWVFSIYTNKLRDHFGNKKRARLTVDLDQGLHVAAPAPGFDVAELLAAFDRLADGASRACAGLFAELADAFLLGRSQKDVAQDLGIAQNTLNKRLARCRQWVKEVMGEL